jgi:ribonuclease-3
MRSPGQLEKRLGYEFSDPALLQMALTHRSLGSNNNERLEFLGDAILGCVIAGELFRRFTDVREGRLSRLRSSLVRGETLAEIGKSLDIGDFLLLGQGERKSGGHHRDSIISNTVEAVLGAIYLDSDFMQCRQCILHLFADKLETLSDEAVLKDPKTRLQELLQAQHKPLPEYRVSDITGVAHAQRFLVICEASDQEATRGEGTSRRQAEQDAAERMLDQLAAN